MSSNQAMPCFCKRLPLRLELLLIDFVSDYGLCLFQDQEAGGSQGMVLVWDFSFDCDGCPLKFDGSFGDQQMPVRSET
jgi:hypothetical protein